MDVLATLMRAYLGTRYAVVEDPAAGVVEARIGAHSARVDAILERHGARSGIFLTAWNPGSRTRPRPVNEAAQRRLDAELRRRGIVCLPHLGIGDDPAWEPEQGVLALDLPLADALALAEAFGQNALVEVRRGEPARLRLTALMPCLAAD